MKCNPKGVFMKKLIFIISLMLMFTNIQSFDFYNDKVSSEIGNSIYLNNKTCSLRDLFSYDLFLPVQDMFNLSFWISKDCDTFSVLNKLNQVGQFHIILPFDVLLYWTEDEFKFVKVYAIFYELPDDKWPNNQIRIKVHKIKIERDLITVEQEPMFSTESYAIPYDANIPEETTTMVDISKWNFIVSKKTGPISIVIETVDARGAPYILVEANKRFADVVDYYGAKIPYCHINYYDRTAGKRILTPNKNFDIGDFYIFFVVSSEPFDDTTSVEITNWGNLKIK